MDPLGNLLTTRPIQTGWEYTIQSYPCWRFGCVDKPDYQFGNVPVWTQTRTRRDDPEPLLPLLPVRLEIWASTYRSTIFKTHVFSICSHASINRATHLLTVYLAWLPAVLESCSRSPCQTQSSKHRDALQGCDRASLEMQLEAVIVRS